MNKHPNGENDARSIATPHRTKAIMKQHGLSLKKSLGQNFLVDQTILQRIAEAAQIDHTSAVLEIGPGIGALTEHLARLAGKVVAVEIDQRIVPVLRDLMAPYDRVSIIHGDILALELSSLFQQAFDANDRVSVVANLPYYITTPIIMKLLEEKLPLHAIVVMIQKEVAERMTAKPGGKDYGSLSIAVQYYCEAELVMVVPPHVFIPPPKVDSAVMRLTMRKEPVVDVNDESFFFQVVRASFAQRRKTVFNNLATAFFAKEQRETLRQLLSTCGIDPTRRGETLSIAEFARLSDALLLHVNI